MRRNRLQLNRIFWLFFGPFSGTFICLWFIGLQKKHKFCFCLWFYLQQYYITSTLRSWSCNIIRNTRLSVIHKFRPFVHETVFAYPAIQRKMERRKLNDRMDILMQWQGREVLSIRTTYNRSFAFKKCVFEMMAFFGHCVVIPLQTVTRQNMLLQNGIDQETNNKQQWTSRLSRRPKWTESGLIISHAYSFYLFATIAVQQAHF